ncbi:hypothetical protein WR25_18172 [Diploscapter pachys]|uniref:RNA polymerase III subunit Rpc25 domain-containing protein n=1 Tax=Diploscapter pachys TaxID=2018661 RepID=A0A2A2JHT6_9BILA|nr:hypothetical protein WR25_18172 [Diploscapter pachys]
MFVLALIQDTVVIKPHELEHNVEPVVKQRLNQRLANRVVPELGLCMCVYDIVHVGVTYILPGEGQGHVRVKFRMVVLRPFVGEVIEARVVGSSRLGLTLSIEFFADIFVPADRLPDPHVYEEAEQIWYWEYPSEDDSQPPSKLYMDPGKIVKFKVVENIFKDISPDVGSVEAKEGKSYEIIGTMAETGLGCVGWWAANEEAADEEQEEDLDMGEE